jgi:arsenate reductase
MAAAFFNHRADPARARAISAGMGPGAGIYPAVFEVMRELGVDLSPRIPQRLSVPLAMSASHVIAMGCDDHGLFFPGVRLEEWPVEDPRGKPPERVRQIRDEIRRRVEEMIESNGWGRTDGSLSGTGG